MGYIYLLAMLCTPQHMSAVRRRVALASITQGHFGTLGHPRKVCGIKTLGSGGQFLHVLSAPDVLPASFPVSPPPVLRRSISSLLGEKFIDRSTTGHIMIRRHGQTSTRTRYRTAFRKPYYPLLAVPRLGGSLAATMQGGHLKLRMHGLFRYNGDFGKTSEMLLPLDYIQIAPAEGDHSQHSFNQFIDAFYYSASNGRSQSAVLTAGDNPIRQGGYAGWEEAFQPWKRGRVNGVKVTMKIWNPTASKRFAVAIVADRVLGNGSNWDSITVPSQYEVNGHTLNFGDLRYLNQYAGVTMETYDTRPYKVLKKYISLAKFETETAEQYHTNSSHWFEIPHTFDGGIDFTTLPQWIPGSGNHNLVIALNALPNTDGSFTTGVPAFLYEMWVTYYITVEERLPGSNFVPQRS